MVPLEGADWPPVADAEFANRISDLADEAMLEWEDELYPLGYSEAEPEHARSDILSGQPIPENVCQSLRPFLGFVRISDSQLKERSEVFGPSSETTLSVRRSKLEARMKYCAITAVAAVIAVSSACGISFQKELIDERALELEPGEYYVVSFELPDDQGDCRLTGRIIGLAGRNKDFDVLILDDDGLANWKVGGDAAPFFEEYRTAIANLDVPLAGSGKFHLVMSNAFSVYTTKTIQAKAKVTCSLALEISSLPDRRKKTHY